MSFDVRDHVHRRVEIYSDVLDLLVSSDYSGSEQFKTLFALGHPCVGPNWGHVWRGRMLIVVIFYGNNFTSTRVEQWWLTKDDVLQKLALT